MAWCQLRSRVSWLISWFLTIALLSGCAHREQAPLLSCTWLSVSQDCWWTKVLNVGNHRLDTFLSARKCSECSAWNSTINFILWSSRLHSGYLRRGASDTQTGKSHSISTCCSIEKIPAQAEGYFWIFAFRAIRYLEFASLIQGFYCTSRENRQSSEMKLNLFWSLNHSAESLMFASHWDILDIFKRLTRIWHANEPYYVCESIRKWSRRAMDFQTRSSVWLVTNLFFRGHQSL
jgi:hypothetical protein